MWTLLLTLVVLDGAYIKQIDGFSTKEKCQVVAGEWKKDSGSGLTSSGKERLGAICIKVD